MKVLKWSGVIVMFWCLAGTPAFGFVLKNVNSEGKTVETGGPDNPLVSGGAIGAGIGAAMTILGAGIGFGRIGGSALESMARQPEVAGRILTGMIVIAAILEGATFFSLIVCILINGNASF